MNWYRIEETGTLVNLSQFATIEVESFWARDEDQNVPSVQKWAIRAHYPESTTFVALEILDNKGAAYAKLLGIYAELANVEIEVVDS